MKSSVMHDGEMSSNYDKTLLFNSFSKTTPGSPKVANLIILPNAIQSFDGTNPIIKNQ